MNAAARIIWGRREQQRADIVTSGLILSLFAWRDFDGCGASFAPAFVSLFTKMKRFLRMM